jgi:pimeloyl-ACP methyl ester carboxylesterase
MIEYARAAGGRLLAFETWGGTSAYPVFMLHGSPGSRASPRPEGIELDLLGVRLIAYDRPGYGESDRQARRCVADAAADVAAIADALGIKRFGVVGRSGGAPHALACAALLPDRVTAVASLVSLAPRSAQGLDWLAGMAESNRRQYELATQALDLANGDVDLARMPSLLSQHLSQNTDAVKRTTADFLRVDLDGEMPAADRRILGDPRVRAQLAENFRVAVADKKNMETPDPSAPEGSPPVLAGWLDDTVAFLSDWGFAPENISVPVLLWHGEQDVFSPVSHSRWLAERIPTARLVVQRREAHFGALVIVPEVLQWVTQYS